MIVSFKCPDTEALASGRRMRRFVNIERVAVQKLRQLQIAVRFDDLRVPPGIRLEPLKGNRAGQYSVRINDQFRICFRWTRAGAEGVEIIDYHQGMWSCAEWMSPLGMGLPDFALLHPGYGVWGGQ